MFWIDFSQIVFMYQSPVGVGIFFEVIIICIFSLLIQHFPKNRVGILFEVVYTKMYAFYQDILWKDQNPWILHYILTLFCVIFFSNALWVFLELIAPFFGISKDGEFHLDHFIVVPSSDINFNLAMAIMSTLVIIYIQLKLSWLGAFLYQFVPFKWKWYIPLPEKKNFSLLLYYPLAFFLKAFDILISVFLWLLDLTEYFARIISLSFRLFGNMMSGGILIGMVFVWLWAATTFLWASVWNIFIFLFSFIGLESIGLFIKNTLSHNFPIVFPLILYIEEIVVSFIQAMVFALLVSIFIKVSQAEAEE